jgi:hypothetical protein
VTAGGCSMFGSCRYTYRRLPYVSRVALHPKSCTLIYTSRDLDAIHPSIIPILPFYMGHLAGKGGSGGASTLLCLTLLGNGEGARRRPARRRSDSRGGAADLTGGACRLFFLSFAGQPRKQSPPPPPAPTRSATASSTSSDGLRGHLFFCYRRSARSPPSLSSPVRAVTSPPPLPPPPAPAPSSSAARVATTSRRRCSQQRKTVGKKNEGEEWGGHRPHYEGGDEWSAGRATVAISPSFWGWVCIWVNCCGQSYNAANPGSCPGTGTEGPLGVFPIGHSVIAEAIVCG